jgi:hypothetical protein
LGAYYISNEACVNPQVCVDAKNKVWTVLRRAIGQDIELAIEIHPKTDCFNSVLKNGFSGRDPSLGGFCKGAADPACGGTALSKTPCAWAAGPMCVLQHPVR